MTLITSALLVAALAVDGNVSAGNISSGSVTGRLAPIGPGYRRADRRFGGIPSVAVSPKNGRLWRTYDLGGARAL